jgi:hypothetical protein
VSDDSLELWPEAGASFNIGIMMFRQGSMAFVGETFALTSQIKLKTCS